MNADEILAALGEIRAKMACLPHVEAAKLPTDALAPAGPANHLSEFEYESIAAAVEGIADELHGAISAAHAKLLAEALEIYYSAEELARDPAHAHLLPHVEAMRAAYERDFGMPIPQRER